MDQRTGIERIRTATFSFERRGYDKREVEQFLNRIADWLETGGGDEARADVVKRELERVGQRTAGILATAEDSAEQIRADAADSAAQTVNEARATAAEERAAADDYAAKTRADADAYAQATRGEADEYDANSRRAADAYAEKTRREADDDASRIVGDAEHQARNHLDAAQAKAARIVDEGTERRRGIEAVIADLVDRRDELIADARRLADELRQVAASHAPGGEDRFAAPSEPDPDARVSAK